MVNVFLSGRPKSLASARYFNSPSSVQLEKTRYYIEEGNIGWSGEREVLLTSLESLEIVSAPFLQVHPLLVVVLVEICLQHPSQSNPLILWEKVHKLTKVSFPGPPINILIAHAQL